MRAADPAVRLSVIIPTYRRAALLRASLESLTGQTLSLDQFEVIVVDDGSDDDTADVCRSLMADLPLRYCRIEHSGTAAAKNLGIFTARAPLVYFADDDDLAGPELLAEHLATHERYPGEHVAVLGYRTWAPDLEVAPLMHFVTDVGQRRFGYTTLSDDAVLDFWYFWGGRSSCKRSLLAQHGIFNRHFRGSLEDVELGYRLSKFGLRVVFNRRAASYVNHSVELDTFCDRMVRRGRDRYLFGQIHRDAPVPDDWRIRSAQGEWLRVKSVYPAQLLRARTLEAALAAEPARPDRTSVLMELWQVYQFCFDALNAIGIVVAARAGLHGPIESLRLGRG